MMLAPPRRSVFRAGGVFRVRAFGPPPIAHADWRGAAAQPNVTVSRASAGTAILGGAVVEYASNTQRVGDTGLLIEPSATNENTNPRNEGATVGVIGSGGALPTGHSVTLVGGITMQIVALPSFGSLTAVRYRISGTPGSSNPVILRVTSNSTSTTGTMVGTVYYRVVGGSYENGFITQTKVQAGPIPSA